MEFIDPVVEQKATAEEDKTPQAVNQLESEIDKAYTTVEKKFADLWTTVGKNTEELQNKYHLEEHKNELLKQLSDARANIEDKTKAKEHLAEFEAKIKSLSEQIPAKALDLKSIDLKALGSQANTYLDTLDSKLEVVEQQAGKYVSQFTSFLSGFVSVQPDATPEKEDKEVLFTTKLGSNPNYGTSRYDSDLFKLHTSPEMYLDDKLDGDLAKFDVDSKTKVISELVAKYDNTLHKLMNELVPVKIAYNVFWYRYFQLEDNLKKQDEQRKKLLDTKETKKADDDDDFNWDDDDDEEPVDVGKEDKDDWE